ncbi:hypothetical protein G6F56_010819 [Rhizopus delemar]|nr:hypothetical protein G6F56_010819 [Rhizopus delemar]
MNRHSKIFMLWKRPTEKKIVKISQEPPMIVYFERDILEDSFECIFDPQVLHDEENDYPDLSNQALKPWQRPPYASSQHGLFTKLKALF